MATRASVASGAVDGRSGGIHKLRTRLKQCAKSKATLTPSVSLSLASSLSEGAFHTHILLLLFICFLLTDNSPYRSARLSRGFRLAKQKGRPAVQAARCLFQMFGFTRRILPSRFPLHSPPHRRRVPSSSRIRSPRWMPQRR